MNDALYTLLPAVYRERDAAEGYPLRGLLRLIEEQADLVEGDIQQLYDDLFIETCRAWVIPYIGDLVGNDLLYSSDRLAWPDTASEIFTDLTRGDLRPSSVVRTRADVAKTIYYRRRKGTLPMLEELARDVTGWPAHAVEFFELLGWTQFREHYRPQSRWTDVRSVDEMDRIGGAFDITSHTVDVRAIAERNQRDGWHNIHNIGFFLWRLRAYPLANVPARQAASAPWRWHVSPLGAPAPLFTRWRREGDETGLATELHVPAPMRRPFFYEDLTQYWDAAPPRAESTNVYGLFEPIGGAVVEPCPDCSVYVVRNGTPVTAVVDPLALPAAVTPQIVCRLLDPWPAVQPSGRIIAIDPAMGRIAIGDGWPDATTALDVYYHYGFSADMGGGPYDRRAWMVRDALADAHFFVAEAGGALATHTSVSAALATWVAQNRPNAIITILDSRTYDLPAQIDLRNEGWLAIEAANEQRPLLRTQAAGLTVTVDAPVVPNDPDRDAALTFSGVAVEGFVQISGDLGLLRVMHSTLVPGRALTEDGAPVTQLPSLIANATDAAGAPINTQLRVQFAYAIAGALDIPNDADRVWILDSIVDGAGAALAAEGPTMIVERSTLFGALTAHALEMSESIVTGHVQVERTQDGCVRFSALPPGSVTPSRYRCQPDLAAHTAVVDALAHTPTLTTAQQDQIAAEVEARVAPLFTDRRYGQPAYAQLALACACEIRTGAEDGAEMGAFSHLKHPQRESNLRLRLREYLPFGLDAGIIYVT